MRSYSTRYRRILRRFPEPMRHRGGMGNLSTCRDCGRLVALAYFDDDRSRDVWAAIDRDGTAQPCAR